MLYLYAINQGLLMDSLPLSAFSCRTCSNLKSGHPRTFCPEKADASGPLHCPTRRAISHGRATCDGLLGLPRFLMKQLEPYFGVYYTVSVIRNPQNSIGFDEDPYMPLDCYQDHLQPWSGSDSSRVSKDEPAKTRKPPSNP